MIKWHKDYEKWVNRIVRVTDGPYKGFTGTVETWFEEEDPEIFLMAEGVLTPSVFRSTV